MACLTDLPPELVLNVLSHLPIPSIHSVMLGSRFWHQFILTHEWTVYHHAACYHRYVSSVDIPLSEAKALYNGRAIDSVESWREFCT